MQQRQLPKLHFSRFRNVEKDTLTLRGENIFALHLSSLMKLVKLTLIGPPDTDGTEGLTNQLSSHSPCFEKLPEDFQL